MACNARQQIDEMYCSTCNLRWDMNDPSPPKCKPGTKSNIKKRRKRGNKSRMKSRSYGL